MRSLKKHKTLPTCLLLGLASLGLVWLGYFLVQRTLPPAVPQQRGSQGPIILKGANSSSNYSRFLGILAKHLQAHFGQRYRFVLETSAGSIENIKSVQEGRVHISIVQEDVAYYFFRGGHRVLQTGHQKDINVRSLCYLFKEYVFVIADPSKKTLQDLRVVNIGSNDAGALVSVINIQEQFRYPWRINTQSDPLALFRQHQIDAFMVLTNDVSYVTKRFAAQGAPFHILSFDQSQRSGLTASFPFYRDAQVSLHVQGRTQRVRTIATRALLVVHQALPDDVVQYLVHLFTNRKEYRRLQQEFPGLSSIRCCYLETGELCKDDQRFSGFPLPQHPQLLDLKIGRYPYATGFVLLIPLFFTLGFLIYLKKDRNYKRFLGNRTYMGISLRVLFETFWIYLLLLNVVLCYIIVACYAIKYLEIQTFLRGQMVTGSKFIEMGLGEIFTWLLVFGVTGYEDLIFPENQLAKIIATSVPIVGIGGVMLILGRVSADYIKTIVKGEKMQKDYRMRDHIIICNWNPKAQKIIEEVHSPLLKEHGMMRPIIVIAEGDIHFPDMDEYEDTVLIPGDPSSEQKLRNANVQDAFSVIILADERLGESADSKSVMIAMEIMEIMEKVGNGRLRGRDRLHVTAEVLDAKNIKYLKRVGVNEVISGNDMGLKLLAQTAVTPGITHFMDDILHYSEDSNEVYLIDPPKKLLENGGATFPQIIEYMLTTRLSDNPVLMLGVQPSGDGAVLINPSPEEFKHLQPDDKLLVLARSRPYLE